MNPKHIGAVVGKPITVLRVERDARLTVLMEFGVTLTIQWWDVDVTADDVVFYVRVPAEDELGAYTRVMRVASRKEPP